MINQLFTIAVNNNDFLCLHNFLFSFASFSKNTCYCVAIHILKHSLNFLLEDNSHIVTISSIAAKMGMGNLAAYSASKYALTGMIESLKAEWRDYGFRFSTLFPGAIATGLWENIDSEIEFPKEQMMEIEDVLNVLDMVINSSSRVQFSEVIFTHKQGVIR